MLYSTVVSATALIPILLVDPLAHYTLIMVPFVLFWLGFVCLEGLGAIGVRDFPRRVLIVLNVLFALGIVASGKPYATANGVRPVLSEVRQLIEIWPKGRMIVMGVGSGWYVGYLGSQRVTPIEPLGTVYGGRIQEGSDSLYSLIGRYSPDVVLINRDLTASKNFRTDSLAALRPDQWAQCSLGEDKWYFRVGKADTRAKCFSDAPSQYPARY
jgi:hypothetical protein